MRSMFDDQAIKAGAKANFDADNSKPWADAHPEVREHYIIDARMAIIAAEQNLEARKIKQEFSNDEHGPILIVFSIELGGPE